MAQNRTAGEFVFERIRREIMVGHLVPGQRLIERELTERFDVSRTPVREALKLLVRTQLAVNIPYRGVEVRRLSSTFARDLYDLRRGTEGIAAYLAAERATAEELATLERVFTEISERTSEGKREDVMLLNNRFHRLIAKATHNDLLVERVDELWTNVNLVRASAWRGNRRTEGSRDEHRAILEALTGRKPEDARRAVEEHVQSSWRAVEAAMPRSDDRPGEEAGEA